MMSEISTSQLLLIVNAYVLLALMMFAMSVRALVCRLWEGCWCTKKLRSLKFLIAIVPMLTCLAALAFGLFALAMSHGSGPESYQVVLFVVGCLTPFVLLILWIIGFLAADILLVVTLTSVFIYFSLVNPVLYMRYWAEDNYQWAQLWIAEYYEGGRGVSDRSEAMARFWYQKAALNGSAKAQYKLARAERHRKNAKKYYLMAAEQGHADAMIELIRLTNNRNDRQHWLSRALAHDHPEALFLSAEDASKDNLPRAREQMVEAAEKGSRSAMLFLVSEYRTGGVLFDLNASRAEKWKTALMSTPPAEADPQHLTFAWVKQQLEKLDEISHSAEEPETLLRKANRFLRHPAKDTILHERALDYLKGAAAAGSGEAAQQIAKIIMQDSKADTLTPEALGWYRMAAEAGNVRALETLTLHFKKIPDAAIEDLSKSELYNLELLEKIQEESGKGSGTVKEQHWLGELRDTRKSMAQLQRLGGSWQEARRQAKEEHSKEFQLAKELIASGQYKSGMARMQSAAQRGNSEARFELASQTLNGPRSFSGEVKAVSTLQELDREGFLPASLRLAMLYQSGNGVVPKNLYLAHRLYLKVQADDDLREKADRRLAGGFEPIERLRIMPGDNALKKVEEWYAAAIDGGDDTALLHQQYRALKHHFGDFGELRRKAEDSDGSAQYELAQGLQSHNLDEAMLWLERSAENGSNAARYELAVRMIRGKKNPPETVQKLKELAFSAADSGHVGAMVFIAGQYRIGNGGFEKNSSLAKKYYNLALAAASAEVVFAGLVAGKAVIIKRADLLRAIEQLERF